MLDRGKSDTRPRAKVAYLINQYPKGSHTFIRRELLALEALGQPVERFSIRRMTDALDAADQLEATRTHALLDVSVGGALALGASLLKHALTNPARFVAAAKLTWRVAKKSDRALLHPVYLAEACRLASWVRSTDCRHIHAHFGTNSATVAMLASTLLGDVGYSFTVHGPEEFDKPDLIALEEKIRHATFVVGVSEFGRSQLYRRAGLQDWGKINVVPCGVDAEFLQDDAPVPVPAARQLVCVGRLCEQKGQLLLVQAAAKLKARGESFKLVLVGDGELRAPIEALIAQSGLGDDVTITGWADGARVRREMLAARALVLPSFAEGLPVVIMEALALGRPVISTYVAGIPELVTPGQCGWLVPAGAIDPLVDALHAVLNADPKDLDVMGDEGRTRVRARHNAPYAARLLMDAFPT